jgi:hypothetical protein
MTLYGIRRGFDVGQKEEELPAIKMQKKPQAKQGPV